jgi:hypothetical protein
VVSVYDVEAAVYREHQQRYREHQQRLKWRIRCSRRKREVPYVLSTLLNLETRH